MLLSHDPLEKQLATPTGQISLVQAENSSAHDNFSLLKLREVSPEQVIYARPKQSQTPFLTLLIRELRKVRRNIATQQGAGESLLPISGCPLTHLSETEAHTTVAVTGTPPIDILQCAKELFKLFTHLLFPWAASSRPGALRPTSRLIR